MKTQTRLCLHIVGVIIVIIQYSCGKEFLDLKRDKRQVTPTTLNDFRAILDDNGYMNYNFPVQLGVIGSDEYYISLSDWEALAEPTDKNGYLWADEIYDGGTGNDWNRGFEKVLFANFVFDGIKQVAETTANSDLRNNLLGEAHFYRGISYFLLSQLFCEPYSPEVSDNKLGLPLRTTADINLHVDRSSLEDTYRFILEDITEAVRLLPGETSAHTRPGKAAALTWAAMIYMQMGDYDEALSYAETALSLNDTLIDYNTLDTNSLRPFPLYGIANPEILFYATATTTPVLSASRIAIDTVLYNSYEEHDLRKKVFFEDRLGRIVPKGGYAGLNAFIFTGITTAECYLVAAECKIMTNTDIPGAVNLLNKLRVNRYEHGFYQPIDGMTSEEMLLDIIVSERKKELVLRGRRWQDLRRYRVEGRLKSLLTRNLNGVLYSLPLESNKWVWPIPPDVILISGIQQNDR